jgi:cyclophilin family peptidyl-prolyl cis-trans isomerase
MLLSCLLLSTVLWASVVAAQDPQTPEALCEAATPASEPETRTFAQAEQVLEAGADYYAIFCTDIGPIYVDLFEDETPITVNSFVFLAQKGYYNNSIFHRVLAGFMAQGGDPTGQPIGTGGPGYQFEDEFVDSLRFDAPGKLAMANAGPATNGSQFFITTVPTPHLDGRHTIFGEVVAGQFNVESIRLRDPQVAPPDAPATVLETVLIINDPDSVMPEIALPEPATREEVEAALAGLAEESAAVLTSLGGSRLVDILQVQAENTGLYSLEDWVATLPESAREEAKLYYTDAGLEYHLQATLNNVPCDLANFPIESIAYGLDVYADAQTASAALRDPALLDVLERQGYAPINVPNTGGPESYFAKRVTACNENMLAIRAIGQRGRFVVMHDSVFPEGVIAPAEQNAEIAIFLVDQLIKPVFEGAFFNILRPEPR